ncbi:hypothetical protein HZC08_02545 [Candidatus Micrarchaeota archaeon]|nr:hypothetical protein [Candidatus Micrarchaeota archaeon]
MGNPKPGSSLASLELFLDGNSKNEFKLQFIDSQGNLYVSGGDFGHQIFTSSGEKLFGIDSGSIITPRFDSSILMYHHGYSFLPNYYLLSLVSIPFPIANSSWPMQGHDPQNTNNASTPIK